LDEGAAGGVAVGDATGRCGAAAGKRGERKAGVDTDTGRGERCSLARKELTGHLEGNHSETLERGFNLKGIQG